MLKTLPAEVLSVQETYPDLDLFQLKTAMWQGYDLPLAIKQLIEVLGLDLQQQAPQLTKLFLHLAEGTGKLKSEVGNELKAAYRYLILSKINRGGDLVQEFRSLWEYGSILAELFAEDARIVAQAWAEIVVELGIDMTILAAESNYPTYGISVYDENLGQGSSNVPVSVIHNREYALRAENIKQELAKLENPLPIVILNGGRHTAELFDMDQVLAVRGTTSHGADLGSVELSGWQTQHVVAEIAKNPEREIVIVDDGVDRAATIITILAEIVAARGIYAVPVSLQELYWKVLDKEKMKDARFRLQIAQEFWHLAHGLRDLGIHIAVAVDKLVGKNPFYTGELALPFHAVTQVVDRTGNLFDRRDPKELPWLMGYGGFDTSLTMHLGPVDLDISIGRNLQYLIQLDSHDQPPMQRMQALVRDFMTQVLQLNPAGVTF